MKTPISRASATLLKQVFLYLPANELFNKVRSVCKLWVECLNSLNNGDFLKILCTRDYKQTLCPNKYLALCAFHNFTKETSLYSKVDAQFQEFVTTGIKTLILMKDRQVLCLQGNEQTVHPFLLPITTIGANQKWLALGHSDANSKGAFLTLKSHNDPLKKTTRRYSFDNHQFRNHWVTALHFLRDDILSIGFASGQIDVFSITAATHNLFQAHDKSIHCLASFDNTLFSIAREESNIKGWYTDKSPDIFKTSSVVTTLKASFPIVYYGTKKGTVHGLHWEKKEELFCFESAHSQMSSVLNKYAYPSCITSLDFWPEKDLLVFSESDCVNRLDARVEIWNTKLKQRVYKKLYHGTQSRIILVKLVKNNLYVLHCKRETTPLKSDITSALEMITFSPYQLASVAE